MSKRINIALIALIALGGLWAWTVSHERANALHKPSPVAHQEIDTRDLTARASAMPAQSFDAH